MKIKSQGENGVNVFSQCIKPTPTSYLLLLHRSSLLTIEIGFVPNNLLLLLCHNDIGKKSYEQEC
jgi:hypothetical protein